MLVIETVKRLFAEFRDLPSASRAGLLVMVAAGLMDLIVHLTTGAHAGHDHRFGSEHAAHLLGIVGMVLVLSGVVIDGARGQLRRAAAKHGGLDRNATR